MSSSDRGVPRGDHVPAGEQQDSIEQQEANLRGEGVQARAANAGEPARETTPSPDASTASERGGSAGGGSPVVDARGPDAT